MLLGGDQAATEALDGEAGDVAGTLGRSYSKRCMRRTEMMGQPAVGGTLAYGSWLGVLTMCARLMRGRWKPRPE
ncbi:hypothetical protein DAT35_04025 [Vitiosangium sp. GDMCC 1.1324]|nr:hypothetical protein DAT35_04025 [Vitiosangium sp. GDMCC 1.1324]